MDIPKLIINMDESSWMLIKENSFAVYQLIDGHVDSIPNTVKLEMNGVTNINMSLVTK